MLPSKMTDWIWTCELPNSIANSRRINFISKVLMNIKLWNLKVIIKKIAKKLKRLRKLNKKMRSLKIFQ